MTEEKIDVRIKVLEQEQVALDSSAKLLAEEFNKTMAAKRNRYAQIDGAIAELKSLLNGQCEP